MVESRFDKTYLDDPRDEQRDACGVGFIASIQGHKSHKVVVEGLEILRRMDHRGGRAADNQTSDGAGLLTQIPHALLEKHASDLGKTLPPLGSYALGMMFLPKDSQELSFWHQTLATTAHSCELELLFLRDVPVDASVLGPIARSNEPRIEQAVFVAKVGSEASTAFGWRIFMLRKQLEEIGRSRYGVKQREAYIVSLSEESVCYKGLLLAKDLANYYLDLKNPMFQSAFAMVHQRFSTNTMPSWPLAQPFRMLCHNGEINTLRGNINAMHARSYLLRHPERQADLDAMGPVCAPGGSDSAMLDNTVEFLVRSGRPLTQVLSMLIPEPWEQHAEMDQSLKDYYEYHSYLMEPWDGPAFIGFAHNGQIGAILDRNGLRPGRYWVTYDGFVIMASEAGVVDRRPEEIVHKGRLSPGRMFVLDMKSGTIVPDQKTKQSLAARQPYGEWLKAKRHFLYELPVPNFASYPADSEAELRQKLLAFGYSKEDMRMILAPMANDGKEPVGSMGNDTPLAVLSKQKPLLYNYFKQLFAQVTNPPIDAIREELVTSLSTHLGAESNLLEETPEHCAVLRLKQPILSDIDLQRIEFYSNEGFQASKVSTVYATETETLAEAIARVCEEVARSVEAGSKVIILSDRDVSPYLAPIPALLITSAVHHALIQSGLRMRCSLVIESGEPREVHHFALLLGYGASAINPYLALAVIAQRAEIHGFDQKKAVAVLQANYTKALGDGILKVMSKMGISTLHSYRGAQIFEALGLSQEFVDRYFTWTPTRIEGLGVSDFDADVRYRHRQAFHGQSTYSFQALPQGGFYHWRREGEAHLHSPQMIASLQKSVRINSREEFKNFCRTLDEQSQQQLNLRGLFRFRKVQAPVPLDEVESVTSIVKRFATGAMSFGSISKEAHETLAIAMNRIGARSNSGEGGEDPDRFIPAANGDLRRSSVKQVASARFGVTSHYLVNADELQIKIAQGAKPGEGGQLPGHKVDDEIARVRHSTPGITLISPPPHHDIYSIEDLAQLIYDLKNANRQARVSVKLVSEVGVGTVAAGVAKAKADVILISGYEGGTGASPISSIKHAGLPWELGLAETHRTLVENHLRGRVVLQADGQLRTPRDIVIAAMLGAEEWGVGTGALIALGCIMMRKCHLNTCPVGIATQDPELRRKFHGQPEHVINYFFLLAEGLRELMADLGFRKVQDMVGRSDLLEKNPELGDERVKKIDVSAILSLPAAESAAPRHNQESQDHGLETTLDFQTILPKCQDALRQQGHRVEMTLPICNTDRSVGTILSSELSKRWGASGLPEDQIQLNFKGSAGQSFMAFGAHGITAHVEGDVNDYCGKGLSGAKVVVVPFEESPGLAEENVICGNVTLYGATSGFMYIRGLAGERFAVRNSGAHAVVEGLGDHGCEYMTGGSVVVLGSIGRNFAAGMSGGYAYVYDTDGSLQKRINTEIVEVEALREEEDETFLLHQLQEHYRLTKSTVASQIIENWHVEKSRFLCVVPAAYRSLMKNKQKEWVKRNARAVSDTAYAPVLEQGGYHG